MTKINIHRRAIKLRKQGKSYSQIISELNLSKSTLSRWLKNYPLSIERIRALRDNSEIRIEKFRETMRKKREKRLSIYYNEQKNILIPLSERELFLSGLFLYWGEGNKSARYSISLNNTDPEVLKFTLVWLRRSLGVSKDKIRVFLHLYSDMNIYEELHYWSNSLNMPLKHFDKPYIKKSKKIDLDQKGFGHGTCGLRISNTVIKDKIQMGIKAIADYYGQKIVDI